MATKSQLATETLGLWTGKIGALYVLDNAEQAVQTAVEKGSKDFSLLAYLQTQSNNMFKVLVEGVKIAVQPLEPEQEKEIERLRKVADAKHADLNNFDTIHETAIIKAVKEKTLTETLALWKDMPAKIQADLDRAMEGIETLRVVNVQKGNAHVAQTYQKRKVSSGSNGNSHNLPILTDGQFYSITRNSDPTLRLGWHNPHSWEFSDNGKVVANSATYPNLSITSWTMVGRIMRVLVKDYTPKNKEFTVKKGDLSHKKLSKVKAGGIKPLTVTIVE